MPVALRNATGFFIFIIAYFSIKATLTLQQIPHITKLLTLHFNPITLQKLNTLCQPQSFY